jgi:hypothetical protein
MDKIKPKMSQLSSINELQQVIKQGTGSFEFRDYLYTGILIIIGLFIVISASQGINFFDKCDDENVSKGSITNKKALLVFQGIGIAFMTQLFLEYIISGSMSYVIIGLILCISSIIYVSGFKTKYNECNIQKTDGEKGSYFFLGMGVGLIFLIVFAYILSFFEDTGGFPSISGMPSVILLSILLIISSSVSMNGYNKLKGEKCKTLFTNGEKATYTGLGFGISLFVMTLVVYALSNFMKFGTAKTIIGLLIFGLITLIITSSFALNTYYRCDDRDEIPKGGLTYNWIMVVLSPLLIIGLIVGCIYGLCAV